MYRKAYKLYSLLSDLERQKASDLEVRNSYLHDLTVEELFDLSECIAGLQVDLFVENSKPAAVLETLYSRVKN